MFGGDQRMLCGKELEFSLKLKSPLPGIDLKALD